MLEDPNNYTQIRTKRRLPMFVAEITDEDEFSSSLDTSKLAKRLKLFSPQQSAEQSISSPRNLDSIANESQSQSELDTDCSFDKEDRRSVRFICRRPNIRNKNLSAPKRLKLA